MVWIQRDIEETLRSVAAEADEAGESFLAAYPPPVITVISG